MMNKKDFQKFYQNNFDRIYRFVFFRTGFNKELAEDLTSEIFFKALRGFDKYNPDISHSAWIFTIAKNYLANYFRDTAKTVEVSLEEITQDYALEIDLQEEIPGFLKFEGFEEFIKIESRQRLLEVLNTLSPDKREVVTLKHLLGYSFREIAEIKSMSEVAVKVMAHRALKELQAKFKR